MIFLKIFDRILLYFTPETFAYDWGCFLLHEHNYFEWVLSENKHECTINEGHILKHLYFARTFLSSFHRTFTDDRLMIDDRLGCFYVIATLRWGWDWSCGWFQPEVEMKSSRILDKVELRLRWVGVKLTWGWIKGKKEPEGSGRPRASLGVPGRPGRSRAPRAFFSVTPKKGIENV